MIPYIMGTIITVATTVIIFTLKIFDVVWVMTGGQFSTAGDRDPVLPGVLHRTRTPAIGSAIAIVLLIAVIPVMIYNLRQFRESGGVLMAATATATTAAKNRERQATDSNLLSDILVNGILVLIVIV